MDEPGWVFDWGWSPAGVPWILQNCWEYYEFTGDTEYMQTHIYPMMKEEATLYDQMLMRDNDGSLYLFRVIHRSTDRELQVIHMSIR